MIKREHLNAMKAVKQFADDMGLLSELKTRTETFADGYNASGTPLRLYSEVWHAEVTVLFDCDVDAFEFQKMLYKERILDSNTEYTLCGSVRLHTTPKSATYYYSMQSPF